MNFNDIGATISNKSAAFKKIRSNSKVFNTNLVHTPSNFMSQYVTVNKLLNSDLKFSESTAYGLKRQHNLTTNAALNASNLNFLDRSSMDTLVTHNFKTTGLSNSTEFSPSDLNFVQKPKLFSLTKSNNTLLNLLKPSSISNLGSKVSFDSINNIQKDIDSSIELAGLERLLTDTSKSNSFDSLGLKELVAFENSFSVITSSSDDTLSSSDSNILPTRRNNLSILNTQV